MGKMERKIHRKKIDPKFERKKFKGKNSFYNFRQNLRKI